MHFKKPNGPDLLALMDHLEAWYPTTRDGTPITEAMVAAWLDGEPDNDGPKMSDREWEALLDEVAAQ